MISEIPLLNVLLDKVDSKELKTTHNLFQTAYNIIRLEDIEISNPLRVIHKGTYNAIIFQKSGETHHLLEEKHYKLEKNTLLFIRESQIHQISNFSEEVSGFILLFSHFFYETFTEKTLLSSFSFFSENNRNCPVENISDIASKELLDLFEHSYSEFSNHIDGERTDQILWAYLHILLIKAEQNITPHNVNYTDHSLPIFQNFENLLQKNFEKHLSVTNYAELLNISPNYLNHICKKIHGKNAKRIIDERLLLEAKRELFSGKQSVSEIAFNLNFKDASYFSRFFKKLSGENPESFRNKHILE